jgi:hypothetical protein
MCMRRELSAHPCKLVCNRALDQALYNNALVPLVLFKHNPKRSRERHGDNVTRLPKYPATSTPAVEPPAAASNCHHVLSVSEMGNHDRNHISKTQAGPALHAYMLRIRF